MALRSSQREATAYHEAGHAVMVHVEGYAVLACTIEHGEGMAGGVIWNNPLAVHASELPEDHDRPAAMRACARIALAGEIAQRRYRPSSWRKHQGRTDREAAVMLAIRLVQSGEQAAALMIGLEQQVRDALATHWRLVEAVAAALVRHGHLSGAVFAVLVDGVAAENS
jgi:hypothetical protein